MKMAERIESQPFAQLCNGTSEKSSSEKIEANPQPSVKIPERFANKRVAVIRALPPIINRNALTEQSSIIDIDEDNDDEEDEDVAAFHGGSLNTMAYSRMPVQHQPQIIHDGNYELTRDSPYASLPVTTNVIVPRGTQGIQNHNRFNEFNFNNSNGPQTAQFNQNGHQIQHNSSLARQHYIQRLPRNEVPHNSRLNDIDYILIEELSMDSPNSFSSTRNDMLVPYGVPQFNQSGHQIQHSSNSARQHYIQQAPRNEVPHHSRLNNINNNLIEELNMNSSNSFSSTRNGILVPYGVPQFGLNENRIQHSSTLARQRDYIQQIQPNYSANSIPNTNSTFGRRTMDIMIPPAANIANIPMGFDSNQILSNQQQRPFYDICIAQYKNVEIYARHFPVEYENRRGCMPSFSMTTNGQNPNAIFNHSQANQGQNFGNVIWPSAGPVGLPTMGPCPPRTPTITQMRYSQAQAAETNQRPNFDVVEPTGIPVIQNLLTSTSTHWPVTNGFPNGGIVDSRASAPSRRDLMHPTVHEINGMTNQYIFDTHESTISTRPLSISSQSSSIDEEIRELETHETAMRNTTQSVIIENHSNGQSANSQNENKTASNAPEEKSTKEKDKRPVILNKISTKVQVRSNPYLLMARDIPTDLSTGPPVGPLDLSIDNFKN